MHRHHHFFGDRHERHGRGHWGHWGDHARDRHHGRHRGERFMEHGDLRFVVLSLIAEQPRHGYELIKELEERTGGAYRPSPGVIYPLLSLLEDEGFIRPRARPRSSRTRPAWTPSSAAWTRPARRRATRATGSAGPWPTSAWRSASG